MLEKIREGSQGIVAKSILGLVILTFAISGIGSYISSKSDSAVATVNGVEIGQAELEQAYQRERSRMQAQFGQMFEQLLADENYVANFRKGVLERLVVEELQKQQALELGVRVGDQQIRETILNMPEFQQAGEFNNDIYLAKLRQVNLQPNQFRDYLRQQMTRGQYVGAVLDSEFVLPSEQENFKLLQNQVRSFEQAVISASKLESEVTVEQQDLENYYNANLMNFQTEEKVALEYILLDSTQIGASISVSEQDMKTYYEQNLVDYTQKEKRRFSHILVELGDDAEQKIAEVKSKLDAGEDFAALAKQYSEDSFSAENGGDLEWLENGDMDPAFDAAAFALTDVGQTTDVVESEFGFHIIKLTEFKPEVVQPFEAVKDEIRTAQQEAKLTELYIDIQNTVTQIAFEVPDTLEDAATESGLKLQHTELLTRYQLPTELASPAVAAKVFDPEFIAEGLNSDLIEIDDTKSVVVRIKEHQASRQQSLEEVKTQVTRAVTKQKATELAEQKANAIVDKVLAGESLTELLAAENIAVERLEKVGRNDSNVAPSVLDKVFALAKPQAGKQEVDMVTTNNGDAVLIALTEVTVDETKEINAEQLAALINEVSARSLVDAARNIADIK